ncbi:Panacea domain-containing protein [Bacillus sp. AFS017336]|uniref:Panacea domain-containing protein n=1 Tax=Bacillus sp. AFS017336 TaxID=2033489 RepID=UPI000BF04C39|nr:type II toxin-antitoxin system antitoxin SocA domain-containing protein [Bacillus sp. AFS017336]PEL08194.1 hypothetical protein CN601_18200 [Bacillus sp. AFS017336]
MAYITLEERLMTISALGVAKWFLMKNNELMKEYDSEFLTPFKLQSLLYYAQGTHLAYAGEELFADEIFAYEEGPVVPRVYEIFQKYKTGIPFKPKNEDISVFKFVQKSELTKNVLESVFNYYGKYSTWQLCKMTNEQITWTLTPENKVIEKEFIKKYFEDEVLEGE